MSSGPIMADDANTFFGSGMGERLRATGGFIQGFCALVGETNETDISWHIASIGKWVRLANRDGAVFHGRLIVQNLGNAGKSTGLSGELIFKPV